MGSSAIPADPQVINLNRLLASQERQLLSATADPNTYKSRYDRARIRAVCSHTLVFRRDSSADSTLAEL